jgi:cephalosporin hydroxylase
LIYVDGGRVAEYATWVRTLDFVAVTDADLNDTYESALKQFEQNNNKQAISGFMAYTASFPREYILYRLISTWRKHTSLKD